MIIETLLITTTKLHILHFDLLKLRSCADFAREQVGESIIRSTKNLPRFKAVIPNERFSLTTKGDKKTFKEGCYVCTFSISKGILMR